MIVEDKLTTGGLSLPDLDAIYRTNRSGARFLSHFAVQNLLYLSGTTPVKDGQPYLIGVVGKDLTLEQGYEAAHIALLNALSIVRTELGTLDRVKRIVRLVGHVASAEGFVQQPAVINGASDLLVSIFGEAGRHARVAVGSVQLPLNSPVELELIVQVS